MFEIVQTRIVERWPQKIYDILRELLFAFPRGAQRCSNASIATGAARGPRGLERLTAFEHVSQVMLSKMLFRVEGAFESDRFGLFQSAVGRRRTRLFLPIRDGLGVGDDFNLVLL